MSAVGKEAFQRQLYQSMLGQALNMKSNIETRRAGNSFGLLVWQLNEIWPTGTKLCVSSCLMTSVDECWHRWLGVFGIWDSFSRPGWLVYRVVQSFR